VSTPAIVLFVVIAVAFIVTLVLVFRAGRSVYRRARVLAQELTSLAADLERTMDAVGQPALPARMAVSKPEA
jgi:uncharacterized protein YpmB